MSAIPTSPSTAPHPSPPPSVSSPLPSVSSLQNSVSSVLKTPSSASALPSVSSVFSVSSVVNSALPPAERAWALCCQGLRSPAIAAELAIPERTIRSWLDRASKELLEERQATRTELLALALERHFAIAAAAWRDHDRTALATERAEQAGDFAAAARMAAIGARSLTVALAAQREIARLQGLHIIVPPPPPPVDFIIAYRPEGPLDLEALAAEEAAEQAAIEQAAEAEAEAYDAAYAYDDPDNPDNPDNADPSGDLLQHDALPTPQPAPSVSSVPNSVSSALNTSGSPSNTCA